ncbi:hypothetical protein NYE54_28700 [Paenibacillus sp. FSL K6-1330]|uniref:hypothetical protein n=1 Tax=Paenibacillus sp. FSL K6-1330 TaxID=2975292 RepID=UPI0030DBF58C
MDCQKQRPDFRTINRFRPERMKDVLEKIFTSVLLFLAQENYVKLEHYFVDSTFIFLLPYLYARPYT